MALLAVGCAPVGERYQLLPAPAGVRPQAAPPLDALLFPGGRSISPPPRDFVFTESPLGGVFYGAWNGCAAERDELFYEGFLRGRTLELQPLGRFAEVRPYCGFALATDGDNIAVSGGSVRSGGGWFRARLYGQVLILDPERGSARRLSPPRRFTRRPEMLFFHAPLGSYILQDHRGANYRLRLP